MRTTARQYEEKRRYIRMQVDAPARLTLDDGASVAVTCIDLSSHGVQFETHEAPFDGMEAEFLLEPGGGPVTPLMARIKVCRITELGANTYRAGATIEMLC
ncbi:PilZ domain-containing protein [uncultured Thalassolituus sp.]|jgi:hypothetical protein|uniref:PilZ domain-containing protein n=1 Tax=uncultured Thalassolituus sp. TaxID=285273 RepID=UPI00261647BB|nr:PilZ domain-containing protein [uncultured Thalassolituus sp.]